ncbi:MAG: NAD-dependent epimerase/dehydratase family protein [Candidatus Microthrix subdominans]|nr:NAD-dependent epimerase/dehydratase family protein [Ilumatobacteraceae bacterium]
MKALVVGANGLIGAHISKALIDSGHHVRGVTRVTSDRSGIDDLPMDLVDGDVLDPVAMKSATAGSDVVFHTAVPFAYAGQVDDDVDRTAAEGTANVLRACAANGVDRVVITSSSVVLGYSSVPSPVDETHAPMDAEPVGPGYVDAKVRQDRAALQLAEQLDLDVVLACPTMTIGRQAARLGPSNAIVVQYLADPFGSTYAGGINVVAAPDVGQGHVILAERGRSGERYLLGGDDVTWAEVHEAVAELCGVAPPRFTAAPSLTFWSAATEELRARVRRRPPLATREQARMTGRYYWYSSAKAASLGYRARPAREAFADLIAWLVTSDHVSREMRASMTLHRDVYNARRRAQVCPTVEETS